MHREFESVPKPLHVLDELSFEQERTSFSKRLSQQYQNQTDIIDFLTCVFQLSPYLKDSALKELLFLENLFESGFQKSFEDISLATKSLGLKNLNETDMMREVCAFELCKNCTSSVFRFCSIAKSPSRKTGSGQPEYASRRLRIYYFRYG